jgi:hypothetical protein
MTNSPKVGPLLIFSNLSESALVYFDKNQCCAYGFRKAPKKKKIIIFLEVYDGMFSLELRQ